MEKKKDKFALYKVKQFSQMQMCFLKRHCESAHHISACKKTGVLCVSSEGVLKASAQMKVPPLAMFGWALTTCFTSNSYKDYQEFLSTHELFDTGADQDVELAGNYKYQRTAKQVVHCIGALVLDRDQDFVKNSVRIAIAVDDRDPDRLLRIRCVRPNPTIQLIDITAAVVRGHGTFPEEAANSVLLAIEEFSKVRVGAQDRKTLVGAENVVDERLYDHICNTVFQGASDGCEVEVQGMRLLKTRKQLHRLRYFFRDRAHTSQTIHKGTIKL